MDTRSNAPLGQVAWVLTKADLQAMLEQLRTAVVNVMDHETTGLDEHATTGGLSNGGVAARISITSLTLPQRNEHGDWDGEEPTTWVIPLSHPQSPWLGSWQRVLRIIAKAMLRYRTPFVNAHTKFDARWTYATTGVDIADLISWDVLSTAHLIDETKPTKLKETVPRIFGIERWDDHDLSYPGASEEVDLWELGEYAARDTYWTWRLYKWQLAHLFLTDDPFDTPIGTDEVNQARLGHVARYVTIPTARSLGMMEQRGIRLDIDYVQENLREQRGIASAKLDEVADWYGMDRGTASLAATSKWFKTLTERAIAADDLRITSMTKSGNPQWDKHVIGKQARGGSRLAELILDGRDAAKQAEFLTSWLGKVTPDGIIHSTFRSGHVTTGRLSSADPNMQQVSKKLRKAFIPRPGHFMADLDYSQLELRVAADISGCVPMIEAFRAGQDLHALFAADQLTRRARADDPQAPLFQIADVPPEERQKAKAGNFGLLYLQTAFGFQSYADKVYGVELTEAEAHEVYDGFFATWEGMHEWHERVKRSAADDGYVISPIGRMRNLPNIYDGNEYLRSEAERQAVNSPVQGFGSDLMQMAIASIYGIMPGSTRVQGAHPVATVHDSLVAEVEEDGWEGIVEECQERMVHLEPYLEAMGCTMSVPLAADAVVGTRWSLDDISA